MEFVTENHDYSVTELYLNFKTRFPVLVKVTEGFYGNIEDTFDQGEVLLVAAILKQTRVVANMSMQGRCRLLSIPAMFPEKLCIVRGGKRPTKPVDLSDIIGKYELPLTVRFPSDQILTDGRKSVSAYDVPPMDLVDTFEETYLLGNFITDGQMDREVVKFPLNHSQLRLSPVIVIKRLSDNDLHEYHKGLENESRHIAYDLRVGNQRIAEYDDDIALSGAQLAHVTPVIHDNIVDLFEIVPDVKLRKCPKSHTGLIYVHKLVQGWTRKITSKNQADNWRQNRYSSPAKLNRGFSDTEQVLETYSLSYETEAKSGGDIVKLRPNRRDEHDVTPKVKEQASNESCHGGRRVQPHTVESKGMTIEDDLKRLDQLSMDRSVKSLEFRKHKISRRLPEESDKTFLLDDLHNEDVLKDDSIQSNDLKKCTHTNGRTQECSYRRQDDRSESFNAATQKMVRSKHTKKEKDLLKNATIDE